MKQKRCYILLIVILFTMTTLSCGIDPFAKTRPALKADEVWICEEAPLFFCGYDKKVNRCPGLARTDGGEEERY
jgi:hypothetical protein